jgi:ribosomal protein S18 acetylase RimI-like enzyme
MKLRRAKLDDAKSMHKLLNNTEELRASNDESLYSMNFVIDCIEDTERNVVIVAEIDGELAGFLIAELWKRKKYSYIIDLLVLPKYQGMRVASRILQAYEKYCKILGLSKIVAVVLEDNLKMKRLCGKIRLIKGKKFDYYQKNL